jgi:transposase
MDLRKRVVAAIDEGMSCRAAAAVFRVSAATAVRWHKRHRDPGNVALQALGGDMRSRRVEERRDDIMAIREARKDVTLDELRDALAEVGFVVSRAGLHRFFVRHGITRKKRTGHATEQDRPDVLSQRQGWFDDQRDLEPERLVFIDETWTTTNRTRTHGRCPKGERLRMGFPHGHRKTTALVAGLRTSGRMAPMVPDGPINGEWFEAYVRQVLVPELRQGDITIMDNPSSHKRPAVREAIPAAGATLVFLPPSSPDFNPIEKALTKLKAILRREAERTVAGLRSLIGRLVRIFTPNESENYFRSCGYEPT